MAIWNKIHTANAAGGNAAEAARNAGFDDMNSRPGKFPDLHNFMVSDIATNSQPEYKYGAQQMYRPGDIIHILESEDDAQSRRLHSRIMLVFSLDASGVPECHPFCRHSEPRLVANHWKVTTEDASSSIKPTDRDSPHVGIVLNNGWALKPGITVNLREKWRVETNGPRIAILGFVRQEEWNIVVDCIVQLHNESADSVRLPEAPPETTSGGLAQPTSLSPRSPSGPKTPRRRGRGSTERQREPYQPRRSLEAMVVHDRNGKLCLKRSPPGH